VGEMSEGEGEWEWKWEEGGRREYRLGEWAQVERVGTGWGVGRVGAG